MPQEELNIFQRMVMPDYDMKTAINTQMQDGVLMSRNNGVDWVGRVPLGKNEGLILQAKWHPQYETTINDAKNKGMSLFVDKKTGREFMLDPANPRSKGLKREDS